MAAEPDEGKILEDPVTDVVPEQVAAGDAEPAPTPAVGDVQAKREMVDEPGGLEKVDEKVEEVKEAEEAERMSDEAGHKPMAEVPNPEQVEDDKEVKAEEPKVEESGGEPVAESAPPIEAIQLVVEQRKQERSENPLYTLEIVGNRYNPSNFW